MVELITSVLFSLNTLAPYFSVLITVVPQLQKSLMAVQETDLFSPDRS